MRRPDGIASGSTPTASAERSARVHQRRVQAAGRKRPPEELTECRPTTVVLLEAMEAVLEGHPEKPIKLATNPVEDLYVRAVYLVDAVAPELSAPAAAFIPRPAAAAGAVRRATV